MSRTVLVLAGGALATTLLALAPVANGAVSPGAPRQQAEARTASSLTNSPIKHVVIIYQENHSFDDVLGQLCQERPTPCNGYTGPVTFADGITAQNIVEPDIVPAAEHDVHAQRNALNGKWDRVGGCEAAPYRCVTHIDPQNIPNLAKLANTYAVSDATFAAGKASSFGAHVTLGGGSFEGFYGNNPTRSKTGEKPGEGWGCSSNEDALWGPQGDRSWQPSCIPDRQGRGPYRASLVPYGPTIMQRVEQAGYTWHIYEGETNTEPIIGPWSVCTYFAWCALNRFVNHYDSARPHFLSDAARGRLPNLSILLPTGSTPIGGVSQHNGNSMRLGDNYIGQYVQAAMDGPEWKNTAIFITYDDCGCLYDHVQPPKGLGIRNPMVIISPYAKPGGTDSHVAIQPYSMLAFTEHVFGLKPLTKEVSAAYDYRHAFDFHQHPLPGVTMTRSAVPAWEKPILKKLAPIAAADPA